MCQIINFPDQKDRVEKIKNIMEKKNKQTLHKKAVQHTPPQKKHTIINAITTLQLTGITDLTKTLNEMNDTLKYITDCSYDLAKAIYKLKMAVIITSIFIIGFASAVFILH